VQEAIRARFRGAAGDLNAALAADGYRLATEATSTATPEGEARAQAG